LLEEFAIGLNVGCAWFVDGSQRVANHRIICRGKQLVDMISNMIAETDLNFEMQRRFAHDVEIYSPGFVIIFDPSDLRLVKFKQPSVQLLEKIVYLAVMPVEPENRLGAVLARVDDVVENLVNRGNLQANLKRGQQSPFSQTTRNRRRRKIPARRDRHLQKRQAMPAFPTSWGLFVKPSLVQPTSHSLDGHSLEDGV
jgi:hypothetical protein